MILEHGELRKYKVDKESLVSHFFKRVENLGCGMNDKSDESENECMDYLIENKIDPYTLRQG